jgi:uncharacterized protein (TIGR00288 family)
MAVYLDLENIAIGARDARYPTFSIEKVFERLYLKGHIVVKKAYCDFSRYKEFKRELHDASFELIEIPHFRQSGKNSADIRMVVDALDLCYTKSHVDTFVIISGDSDFSPLVSKLRENAKTVIGVGVKNSSSDLFIKNCDEFIYYDDFVRKVTKKPVIVNTRVAKKTTKKAAKKKTAQKLEGPTTEEALDQVMSTFEALSQERNGDGAIWGSMIKQALKRMNPGFDERAHGFRSFNEVLLEAESNGLVRLEADEKSGGYTVYPS